MIMQRLFLELIQVGEGRLDCLGRAPLDDEWPELYRMAREHGLVAVCYHGVEKMFEYGLRCPQDLVIDWMAAAEEQPDAMPTYQPRRMRSLWRNWLWQRWLERNQNVVGEQPLQLLSLLVDVHERFVSGQLTLQPLLHACRMLQSLNGRFGRFEDEEDFSQQLSSIGLLRFSRGVMWVLQQVFLQGAASMPCEPREKNGRFIKQMVLESQHSLVSRLRRQFM